MYDTFLRVVESRINREVSIGLSSKRASIIIEEDNAYYSLPLDFNGLRDVEVGSPGNGPNDRNSLTYLSPYLMNSVATRNDNAGYYTIVGNQIQIYPIPKDSTLEIIYYAKLSQLSSEDDTNWATANEPDIYIFGLLVEINAFVKDTEAVAIWEKRFLSALSALTNKDQDSRWSGSPMEIKVG